MAPKGEQEDSIKALRNGRVFLFKNDTVTVVFSNFNNSTAQNLNQKKNLKRHD